MPLPNVIVLDMPYQQVMTDSGGRFTLPVVARGALKVVDAQRTARFTLAGYRPVTRVLQADTESEIVLQKDDSLAWAPSRCSAVTDMLMGDVMGFKLPAGTAVSRTEDIDYSSVVVQAGNDSVRLAWGAFWSWGVPGPYFFSEISNLQERSLVLAPDVTVAEYKGTRTDGTRFRYIGMFGETISYDGVSRDSADYFDRIIDSICWRRVPAATRPR